MSAPSISVIMAVRDGERFLNASVESILQQSEVNFEFLIIDDGSFDKSNQILKAFAEKDKRVILFRNNLSEGLPSCLNKLIKKAQGRYIARMDSDDVAHPRRLEVQLRYMQMNPNVGLCFSSVNIMMDSGEFFCTKWSPKNVKTALYLLPYINYFVHPTAFVRRDVYIKDGFYNENFLKGQDSELWQRLKAKGVCFGIIPEVLLDYRLLQSSNSSSLSSSSRYGISYFKAMVLLRNQHKLQSIKFINKISKKLLFRYLTNLLLPHWLFMIAVIINSRWNKNSAVRTLLKQRKNPID